MALKQESKMPTSQPSTLFQWANILLPAAIAIGTAILAGIFGYARFKATAITKKECDEKRKDCDKVETMSTKVDDLKVIVMEQQKQLTEVNNSIGRVEGYLKALGELRNK